MNSTKNNGTSKADLDKEKSEKQKWEVRLTIITECIEYLEIIGYNTAAELMRRDMLGEPSKEGE